MKRSVWAAIALALAVVATSRGQQQAPPPAPEYVPGEVLVQYARAATTTRRNAVLSNRRARLLRRYAEIDSDRVQLAGGESIADAIQAFRALPDVAAVQPNYVRHIVASGPPNDPRWLDDSLWGLIRIQAQAAWNTLGARGDGSVVIMDIDTGINYNHEDLAANVWTNPNDPPNGVDDDGDGYIDDVHGINAITGTGNPLDDNGHGTHTAGTMAAVGNNGVGVVGVNWNAKILACKFLNSAGNGTDADAAECLNYAVFLRTQKGINIRVTNSSWGGYGGNPSVLQNAFTAAGNAGIINFAAAGNDGLNIDLAQNVFYPADLSTVVPSVLAVASMDSTETKSGFSNYGPTHVSLVAPGSGILSTVTGGNNNAYASFSGTSMATPHVAGTAALLSSIDPTLTVAQLRAVITANVDVFPQYGPYVTTGGRLNAFRAASAVGGPTGLPSPWVSQDIGAVGAAGSASAVNGTFTLRGAGDDIWNNADAFQFVYQQLTADGQIVARVTSIQNTSVWAKGGVMIREGLTAGARQASLLVTSNNGLAFERRLSTGGTSLNWPASGAAPQFVRLVRSGGTITAAQSADGGTWITIGSETFGGLTGPVFVGLAVTSQSFGVLGTDTFDNVSVTGGPPNQPPTAMLTGPPEGANFAAPASVALTATANDPDVGDTIDHVAFFANGNPIGSSSVPTAGVYTFTWTNVGTGNYTLTAQSFDNHGAPSAVSNARHVTVGGPTGLPSPWVSQDIGAVGAAGSASAVNGTFTLRGAGDDIWNNADAFQFVYQQLTADGQIVARVTSIQNTSVWAKGGVMIREGLTAGARQASLLVTSNNGLAFERRLSTGGTSLNWPASGAAPQFVRLVRSGGTITAAQSADGGTWTTIGSETFGGLTGPVFVGLAVTSQSFGVLGTDTFDNVSVTGGPPNQPPTAMLTGPPEGANFAAPASVALTATANDPDVGDTIDHVAFFANGNPIGSSSVPTAGVYTFTWTNVGTGNYTLTAQSFDNHGAPSAVSNARHVTVGGPTGLPSPWVSQDIGAVGAAGSASAVNGTFTLRGAGDDIWNNADAFQFVYQQLTADGQIVARVTSIQNTSVWAKGGVMIREGLTAGARQASLLVTSNNGLAFERRLSTGGTSLNWPASGAAPQFVRLVRSGGTITAAQSADGGTWITIGSETFGGLTGPVFVGLAVTSQSFGVLGTDTFDNVSVTTPTGLPSPWVSQDIGAVGAAGSASAVNGTFTLRGAGDDIWNNADAFQFVYQQLTADGQIVARVTSIQNTSVWAKGGVMIREGLTAGARQASLLVTSNNGLAFERRLSTGGTSLNWPASGAAPQFVRLVRSGGTITAAQSADGGTWITIGSETFGGLTGPVFVGLAVTSQSFGVLGTDTFDNVSVTTESPSQAATATLTARSIDYGGLACDAFRIAITSRCAEAARAFVMPDWPSATGQSSVCQ